MGTNYYWHDPVNVCEHCGRGDGEAFHIGKSSAGWCFSLRIHPDDGINDLPDWQERWSRPGSKIVDEYGTSIMPSTMLDIITSRSFPGVWNAEALRENGATRGPNNLARHGYGARPGNGTYDLCNYEFS